MILAALGIREKPTTVRVYEDKNGNGTYDKGEGIPEMNVEGFATSADGSVAFTLPAGSKDIRPVTEGTKYDFVRAIPDTVTVGRFSIWGPTVEIHLSEKPKFAITGRIFGNDQNGEAEGVAASVHIDLNADEVAQSVEPQQTANESGKFSFREVRFPADMPELPLLIVSIPRSGIYQRVEPVAIDLETVEEGRIHMPIELKRKNITISGTVQVLPEGESAEGITVFIDRDGDKKHSPGEPNTLTDKEGNYRFKTPFFKNEIEQLKVLNPNQTQFAPGTFRPGQTENGNLLIHSMKDEMGWEKANFIFRKLEEPKPRNSANPRSAEDASPDDNESKETSSTAQANNNVSATNTAENTITDEQPSERTPNPQADLPSQPIIPTSASDPAAYLRNQGFEGADPREGEETKPVWTFQTNPELPADFNNAKKNYDKAAKKGNWAKIPQLVENKRQIDEMIQNTLAAAKGEADIKRAQQQVVPLSVQSDKLGAELNELKENRNALLDPLIMAARAILEEQQMYANALRKDDDTDNKKDKKKTADELKDEIMQAANELGVEVKPLSKKEMGPWQHALKLLAEEKLRSLGLQKRGRKWLSATLAQEAAQFQSIHQFAQVKFKTYINYKQQLNLLSQNAVANRSRIEQVQRQLTTHTNFQSYKDAIKDFRSLVTRYNQTLDRLESQRSELENEKDAIENALSLLGGNYKQVIKQYPDTEAIEKRRAAVINLQGLVE